MVGSRDSHSQCSHWLWQFVPHGRASGFFNCPRSGSVSRNTPIPCFGGIQDAALAHKRGSLETLGFKRHSLGTFCRYWQKVTRRRQQKREISWTAESCLHKYSPPLRSQRSHRPWQSVPHGRASGFFNCPRSGSVSRNTPIPCFGGIQDAALAHKRGSLETLGFKRHSLGTFCRYWQKVTRRRQQKREISWTAESCLHKYSPPLRSQRSHRPWQSVPHGRASGFFNCPRSGSVSRNTPIPCFGGIQDAALAHKRGSLETLGFKWRSLVTFFRY